VLAENDGAMPSWECLCCGQWVVTVETDHGRSWYRLSRRVPDPLVPGACHVAGEVSSIAALEDLLHREARLGVGDLRLAGG